MRRGGDGETNHIDFIMKMDDNIVLTQTVEYEIMGNIHLDDKERF